MQYYESDTLEKSECGAFKWYGNNKHKSCAVHGACDCCELIKSGFHWVYKRRRAIHAAMLAGMVGGGGGGAPGRGLDRR